jgi:hypothetical protein
LNTKPINLAAVARRAGAQPAEKRAEAQPVPSVEAPKTDPLQELTRSVQRMAERQPVFEVAAPDMRGLAEQIAQGLRSMPGRPTAWRFDVERDVDGLIKTIHAKPAN